MGNLTTQERMITMAKAKRARDAKGHFISNKAVARRKSSGHKSVKRSKPSSPARRASGGGGVTKVTRRRRGVTVGGGVVNGSIRELKAMGPELVASAAYGLVTSSAAASNSESIAGKVHALIVKVPTWDKIGKPASHGILALGVGIAAGGKIRRVLGLLAKAALHRASYNFGASGLNIEAAAGLGDDDDHVHLAGEIDDAEIVG